MKGTRIVFSQNLNKGKFNALNDIHLYETACKEKVRKQIHARFKPDKNRKKYLLKFNRWINNYLLCRWMRKIKNPDKNNTHNQIILENGVYSQFKGKDGRTWLKIPSLIRGKRINTPLERGKGCVI
jgi:hypothetical protein